MNRVECFQKAAHCTCGPRQKDYGDVRPMYDRVSAVKEALWAGIDRPWNAVDAIIFMIVIKVCRVVVTNAHEDSWVDIAGYAGLGVEVATNDSASDRIALAETDYPVEDGYPIETMERMTGRG